MLAWNNIHYDVHQKGTRAYMYWIKGVDYSKAPPELVTKYEKHISNIKAKSKKTALEVVAIPDNEEKLPEYYIVDVDAALKFTFEDRYKLMLEPIFNVRSANSVLKI